MNQELNNFYAGKKVFVTGHSGFKGSWLTLWLTILGAEVKGYALAPSPNDEGSLYNIFNIDQICDSELNDVRNYKDLEKSILEFNPDVVFHLAAQPLVKLSYSQAVETYGTNVMGTVNLLDITRKLTNKCAVVVVTTDKVYENNEDYYPFREIDRLGGFDPYSSSKACAELVVSSFRNSFFNLENDSNIALASARAGNVVGGGDWSLDRLVPDIVRALIDKKSVFIRNPSSFRPWQFVLEPLYGYLMLGQKLYKQPLLFSESWNFGPHLNERFSVGEIAEKIIAIWGEGELEFGSLKTKQHEAKMLQLDISKVLMKLDWQPKYDLDECLLRTVEWYKCAAEKNMDILELSKSQILSYTD